MNAKNEFDFKTLLDGITQGIAISDADSQILYINPSAEKILGVSSEGIRGKALCNIVCENLYTAQGSNCANGCPLRDPDSDQKGVFFHGTLGPKREGAKFLRVYCFKGHPLLNEYGDKGLRFMLIEDTSNEVELERLKEDWNNLLLHDLRSPLSIIISALRLLPTDHPLNSEQEYCRQAATKAAQRMLELLNKYLDTEKILSPTTVVHPIDIPLSGIIGMCLDMFQPILREREIKIVVKVSPQLQAKADPTLLSRVMANLLDNAIKFSSKGGCIEISGDKVPEDMVRISIKDYGKGISSEDLPYIFDRFYQVQSFEKKERTSTGLGLVFCKEAIKAMHGRMDVVSKLGEGSEFFFELPRCEVKSPV